MASSTPNLGLTLPVGGEHVSRQIVNANNVKIDEAVGPVPSGTDLQSQVTALNSKTPKFIRKTLPKNGSVSFSGGELSHNYILTVQGTNATSTLVAVGGGYGATSLRHTVNNLISSNYCTITVDDSAYGLTVSSTADYDIFVTVLQLGY